MATDFTSSYPLLFLGTDILANPSFEEWDSTTVPRVWTPAGAGTLVQDTHFVHPIGVLAARCTGAKTLTSNATYGLSSFGFTAIPSWITYAGLCVLSHTVYRSGTPGTIAWGDISANIGNTTDAWQFTFLERNLQQYTFSVWLRAYAPADVGDLKILIRSEIDAVLTNAVCAVTETWTRFSVTLTAPAGTTSVRCYIGGSSTFGSARVIEISKAQLEWAETMSSSGDYQTTVATSGTRNLLTYSEQIDNSAWTKSGCSVTATNVTDPDAGTTAERVTSSTSDGFVHQLVNVYTSAKSSIVLTSNASNLVIFDSVMLGLIVDLNVFVTDFNPIPKFEQEKRDTPFNSYRQLMSDTWDFKGKLGHFDAVLKQTIVESIRYLAHGHYFAMILDRSLSAPYNDEFFPYLTLESQDSPKYKAGSDAFTFDFNAKGNLP